jgi:serine/threonine protein kinase/WD40 repeat protein
MTQTTSPLDDPRVLEAMRDYQASLDAGQKPDREAFLTRYPDIAGTLAGCLDALEFMHAAAPSLAAVAPPQAASTDSSEIQPELPLGDFRLVREIGRGGMGIVYEAMQQSLGRRVALKVLPFAAALDNKQIQRFKNEAQAAAHLQHPHIVPVYAVGCERGVHYYAMQMIDGRTLASLIGELRRQEKPAAQPPIATAPYQPVPAEVAKPPAVKERAEVDSWPTATELVLPLPPTSDDIPPTIAKGALPTERTAEDPARCRAVAALGIQAAEALEHAHQLGIVHRDIKPGNMLLDASGQLWVTDFGLAQMQGGVNLTMSGDLIGTLRYMSPEQALAQRIGVDHRTDIYSLGATLYELLTLTPAFPGNDRQELLRQIAFDEPRLPRQVNPAIPVDIETIVLKAMEKNPAERYATAQELADDLQRFLKDEPIRAKRATLVQRLRKWAIRHKPVVATAAAAVAVILLLGVVNLAISYKLLDQEQGRTKEQRDQALEAKAKARERLRDSLIAQAQAGRLSGLAGQRFKSLEALTEATRITRELGGGEEDILKLRNEAIACLCLPDLRRRPEYDRYTAEQTGGVLDSQLQRYAVGDGQGDIIIHRIPGDQEIARLQGPGVRASSLVFSPNGQFLAAVYPRDAEGKRGQVFVWDLKRCQVVLRLPPEIADPYLVWSPDDRRLGALHHSPIREIALYDVEAHKEIQGISTVPFYATAFDPNGKRLAILAPAGQVQIRDVETGRVLDHFQFPVDAKRLAWGCDGRFLVASYAEPRLQINGWPIYLWDVPARRMKILEGHRNTVIHVAFSHAGNLLASNGWDGTIRLWNPWTGKEVLRTEGDWGGPWFSHDDHFLQVGVGWSGVQHCWEVRSGREFRQLYTPTEKTLSLGGIQFSPDGRFLAATCSDGVRLWDVASGKHAAWLSPDTAGSFSFDPSGKYIVTRGSVGNYRWPLSLEVYETERRLRIGPPEKIPAENPTTGRRDRRVPSPDGKWLVSSSDKGVRVWDARSGKPVRDLTDKRAGLWFSPDGQWLVTSSDQGYLFWQTDSWTLRHEFPKAKDPEQIPAFVAFSTDSKLTALYCSAWDVRLIHLATGREIARLPNPEPCPLSTLTFNPDGTQLAAPTRTQSIQLWDLHAIREQLRNMDLDWDLESYPARGPIQNSKPLEIQADLGHMWNKEKYGLIIAFFPFYAEAYYQRGLAHARVLKWRQAIDDFSMAVTLNSKHANAYYARELIGSSPADLGGGVGSIDSALAPGPNDDYKTYNNLAWVLATCPELRFRNPTRALELAKRAIERPHRIDCYNTLGVAYYRVGNWKEAIEYLEKAESLEPGQHLAFNAYFLSMAHWKLGETDKALQLYTQGVSWTEKNRPSDEELRRFRAEAEELLGIRAKKN